MTEKELLHIIKSGESERIEFKQSFNNESIIALNAFANTFGGDVYIGINNNGKIIGTDFKQETIPNIINEIKNKTYPSLIPDVEILEIEDKKVVRLAIKEFPIKPVAVKGKYYKRIKNSNHQLNLQEISDFHFKTFNISWDNYITNNYTLNNISIEKIQRFIDRVNKDSDYKIEDAPLQVLRKFELIRDNKVTNACHLLFAENDVFYATIELGRFSDAISIKDGLTVRSDLFYQVDETITFIKKHLNKEYIMSGSPEREERWQYPISAIREIVVNMIVHRDYTHYGASSIKIFNDRIEFYNPGKLPESITIEKVMSGDYVSQIRNLKIATMFKEVKLIEKYGSGFSRIIKDFEQYDLKTPIFENFQEGFRVIIIAEKVSEIKGGISSGVNEGVNKGVNEGVNEGVNRLYDLIKSHPNRKTPFFSDKLSISVKTIERWVKKLRTENKIEFIGSPKTGGYFIIKEPETNN